MLLLLLAGSGCMGMEPEGIYPAQSAATTVRMDFFEKPIPALPLPNDIATRHDATSATGRRINASLVATTAFESRVRRLIDQLDGWGTFQPITIPFTGPLDVKSITDGHSDTDYRVDDDVVYLINVDPRSKEFGRVHHLDAGNGNYPVVLEGANKYWKNDARGNTISLLFEEADEDVNDNGVLDPGEDTDADGVMDVPNYFPGRSPGITDLAGRADALMTFYERQTHTLILTPMMPLRERTTYAVVVTRRIKDEDGRPVGSPYPFINHASQNAALEPLLRVLPKDLSMDDVAFAFSFTTQSVQSHMTAVRDGLYGHGVQAHLGQNFPARLSGLERLRDPAKLKGTKNPYILHGEHFIDLFKTLGTTLVPMLREGTSFYQKTLEAQRYVDYHVIGTFQSPQLFQRYDAAGKPLPYDLQSWPPDLDRVRVTPRDETVYFWLTVPRKEVSARGQGKPAPVALLAHGTGGGRFYNLFLGGLLARFGVATLAIDCPSHGLPVSKYEAAVAEALVTSQGFGPFVRAMLKDRAWDQNNDGVKDPGPDLWSAYAFHTRDMVRQSALDFMQAVRVLRGFDGVRRWSMDVNGDGQQELAGDFNADGVLDVGGGAFMGMAGISFGGIMSMVVGSMEPQIDVTIPISGGAGLREIGIRSSQQGVPEGFVLRLMGPLYAGTLDAKTGEMKMEIILADLFSTKHLPLAALKGVKQGDTMVVENLANGERGCGLVSPNGLVRAGVAADGPRACVPPGGAPGTADIQGTCYDKIQISFYEGYIIAGEKCRLKPGIKPAVTLESFGEEAVFQGVTFAKGSALRSPTEGMGLRRSDPSMRRFVSFAQLIIEPGDPVSYLRHLQQEPLTHPGTQETTGSHMMMVTTLGDLNVPSSSGVTAGRVAGLIEYQRSDPRYGKPLNQVLLDTYTAEAVHTFKRHTNASTGDGVHLDVDNFSQGTDMWGKDLPRLDKPLRIGLDRKDRFGGVSGAIFPLSDPRGSHGFSFPGELTDRARADCKKKCTKKGGSDPCGCDTLETFDIGQFMFNVLGRYFISGGTQMDVGLCNSNDTCPALKKIVLPPMRDKTTLH